MQYLLIKKKVKIIIAIVRWNAKRSSVQIGLTLLLLLMNKNIVDINVVNNKNAGRIIVGKYMFKSKTPLIRNIPHDMSIVHNKKKSIFSIAVMTLFFLVVAISIIVKEPNKTMKDHKVME